jgi:hypothetical protein
MKKIISASTVIIFLASIYFMPSLSAITLGEIKPDRIENEAAKKTYDKETVDTKKNEEKQPAKQKYPEKKIEDKAEEVNPRLVCLLSVVMPGGGHFYMNNDVKGIGFCLAAGIGYTATGFFMVKTMLSDTGTTAYKNYLLLTGFLLFITLIVHFVGIIEAYSDAEEMNKQKLFGNDDNNPYITEFVTN